MRIGRFDKDGEHHYGVFDDEKNIVIPIKGSIFGNFEFESKSFSFEEIKILPPVVPTKVICLGLNYIDHAAELGVDLPDEPVIFIKPTTSVIGYDDDIIAPYFCKRVDYEAELAVVISKICKNVEPSQVGEYILGYTCLNDVTERTLQEKDVQWTRAKSFDTFCPVGPWIETDIDWKNLGIKAILNNEVKQSSNTSKMIFGVDYIVSFVSKVMTLFPGDIISTGTPAGVGEMKNGDIVEIYIEGIGNLRNRFMKI